MSLLCRYFDLGERNDAHLRHDMVAAAWSVMHTCCPVGSGVAITADLLAKTGARGGCLPRERVPCRRCGHRDGVLIGGERSGRVAVGV